MAYFGRYFKDMLKIVKSFINQTKCHSFYDSFANVHSLFVWERNLLCSELSMIGVCVCVFAGAL